MNGRPRLLDAIAIGMTLAVVLALLLPVREDPTLQVLFNLSHVPVFALLALVWAEDLLAKGWRPRRRMLAVALAGMAASIGTELLQGMVPGRYADAGDLARNALGIGIGLAVHAGWPGLLARRRDGDTDGS